MAKCLFTLSLVSLVLILDPIHCFDLRDELNLAAKELSKSPRETRGGLHCGADCVQQLNRFLEVGRRSEYEPNYSVYCDDACMRKLDLVMSAGKRDHVCGPACTTQLQRFITGMRKARVQCGSQCVRQLQKFIAKGKREGPTCDVHCLADMYSYLEAGKRSPNCDAECVDQLYGFLDAGKRDAKRGCGSQCSAQLQRFADGARQRRAADEHFGVCNGDCMRHLSHYLEVGKRMPHMACNARCMDQLRSLWNMGKRQGKYCDVDCVIRLQHAWGTR